MSASCETLPRVLARMQWVIFRPGYDRAPSWGTSQMYESIGQSFGDNHFRTVAGYRGCVVGLTPNIRECMIRGRLSQVGHSDQRAFYGLILEARFHKQKSNSIAAERFVNGVSDAARRHSATGERVRGFARACTQRTVPASGFSGSKMSWCQARAL